LDNWYLLEVDLRFAWGFSVKTPTTSAAEMTLLFPPPSTLIGALARGASYVFEDWSECILEDDGRVIRSSSVRLLEFIISAYFGFHTDSIGVTPWSDILRSYAVPYQQVQHRSKPEMWFGVHASGRIYSPNSLSHIIYVINGSKAEEILGKKWISYLKSAAYSILSIGGKEGLTVTQKVDILKAEIVKKKFIKTSYYCPMEAIEDYKHKGKLRAEEFWDFNKSSPHWSRTTRSKGRSIRRVPYVLPIDNITLTPRIIEARLSNEGIGLTVDDSAKNTVILLKEWVTEK